MENSRGDLSEIKAMLQNRAPDICRVLLPEGHRSGAYWIARSRTADKKVGGLWVAVTGTPGAWRDEPAGEKGDIIALIGYVKFGSARNTRDALAWSRDYLGLSKMSPALRQREAEAAKRRVVLSEQAQAAKHDKDRARAFAAWLEAKKQPIVGSPADVYLQSRGIQLTALTRLPGALGWLPMNSRSAFHGESGMNWPCLVGGMTNEAGAIVAIHRTWLKPDGSAKAPIEPQRKIWPAFKGSAIRLWRGETKMPEKEAAKHGLLDTLVLVEGIEDGLSVALAAPEFRVWAVGSLGNLQSVKLPACSRDVIVAADNDWSKPQAGAMLRNGIEKLMAQGASVRLARSFIGKDVNDALRGAA